MIQANELRIRNLVYNRHGDIHSIGCNCFHRFRYHSMDGNPSGFKPIPLTEEILLKCGFEKLGKYTFVCDNALMQLEIDVVSGKLLHSILSIEVKYLHQFQNLYYALTGEELEVHL